MKYLIQTGFNYLYPKKGVLIDPFNEELPDFFTDNLTIVSINDFTGKPIPKIWKTNKDETIFVGVDGEGLVTVPKDGFIVYSSDFGFKGITKKKIDLIYEEMQGDYNKKGKGR